MGAVINRGCKLLLGYLFSLPNPILKKPPAKPHLVVYVAVYSLTQWNL